MSKPTCKLLGTDSNVFAIIGNVSRTLKQAGFKEQAREFQSKAFSAGSYEEVLCLLGDYVRIA